MPDIEIRIDNDVCKENNNCLSFTGTYDERFNKVIESFTPEQRNNLDFKYWLSTDKNRIDKGDWSLIEDFFLMILNHLYKRGQLKIEPLACIFGPKEIVNKWDEKKQFIDAYVAFDSQGRQSK